MPSKHEIAAARYVSRASHQTIVTTLSNLRGRLRRYDRWLTQSHPYLDVLRAIRPPQPIDDKAIAEYVAASAPLHASDGWHYLARAFGAISHGDRNTAIHLAYYAELRAAMAILASEGIGVLNYVHVVVDSSGNAST